jgi:hypothetical protein
MVIKNSSNSIRCVLRMINCCIILNNLLVNSGDDSILLEWVDDDDVMVEHVGQYVGEYGCAVPIHANEPSDKRRQNNFDTYKNNRA